MDFAENNRQADVDSLSDYDDSDLANYDSSLYSMDSLDSSFSSSTSSFSSTSSESSVTTLSSEDYEKYLRRRNGIPVEPKQPANIWRYIDDEPV